jgi:MFS family permease
VHPTAVTRGADGPSPLRDRRILALMVAETVSTTGSQMSALALPWFVLVTTGSAKQMSVVIAARIASYALCGLPAGLAINRLGSRRIMLLGDAFRGPVVLLVPILHWLNVLQLGHLVAIAVVLGVLGSPYGAAQRVITAEVLGDDPGLVGRANALMQGATRIPRVAGPALAGALISVIGAPNVLVVDAATFVVASVAIAAFVSSGDRSDQSATEQPPRLLDGIRYLRRDRLLGALTAAITVGDAASQVIFIGVPVLVLAHYRGGPHLAGILIGAWGAGAVTGNVVAYRRLRAGASDRLIAGLAVAQAAPLFTLAAPVPAWVIVTALVASGIANGLANPSIHALFTLRPPPAVRPNVITTMMTASVTAAPLALLAAGPAFDAHGPRPTLGVAATSQFLAMVLFATAVWRPRVPTTIPPESDLVGCGPAGRLEGGQFACPLEGVTSRSSYSASAYRTVQQNDAVDGLPAGGWWRSIASVCGALWALFGSDTRYAERRIGCDPRRVARSGRLD